MKTLAILKLDAIGDYILFRNFLEETRKKFPKNKIYLIGNIIWKDLAEKYDSKFIDKFIWINKNNKESINEKIKKLNKEKIDILIHPTYSRTQEADEIAKKINSKEKITLKGNSHNQKNFQKQVSDKYYTKLIQTPENIHEIKTYRIFFEKLLNKNLTNALKIEFKKNSQKKNYAVIFPGASSFLRRWPIRRFTKISNFLHKNHNLDIVVCGSKQDSNLAKKLQKKLNFKIVDKTGKSLDELPEIIGNSRILLTNDTCAAHVGAATKTKTLIISNGFTYKRFVNYPKEYTWVKSVLPPIYPKNFHGPIFLISTNKVKDKIKDLISIKEF